MANIYGYDEDIDLHPDRVQQHARLKHLEREIEQVSRQNEHLNHLLHQFRLMNSNLTEKNNSLESSLTDEKQKNASLQKDVAFLQKNVLKLQAELDENRSSKTALYSHVFKDRVYDSQQEMIINMRKKIENLQEHLEHFLREEAEQISILITENKVLSDENMLLKSKALNAEVHKDDSLVAFKCGRFEVKKKVIECIQCHHVFDSQTEMDNSKCNFHPANPSSTATPGRYYWKCCQTESVGRSSCGCKEGKHITMKYLGEKIT